MSRPGPCGSTAGRGDRQLAGRLGSPACGWSGWRSSTSGTTTRRRSSCRRGCRCWSGPNGVGKTNLIEAIGYLATLGSHRVGQDASLIRAGAASAVIRAAVQRAGRRLLVDVELRPGTGVRGRVNGAPVPRARDLLGVVRATVFAPEDLGLVRGDPEERRRFLDTLATQRLPRYHGSRQDYDRVLRQRNTLLRSAAGRLPASALATLEVWDEKLAVGRGRDLVGAAPAGGGAHAPGRARLPAAGRPGRRGRDRLRVLGRRDRRWPTPTRPSSPRRSASGSSPTAPARSSGGSPCPARTGTTSRSPCAGCPRAPTPPTARPGRWPWPCGSGRTSCSPRRGRSRCCSWTTCSPSSTGNDGTGSRRRPWRRSRRSSPRRSPRSSRPTLNAAVFHVEPGSVQLRTVP